MASGQFVQLTQAAHAGDEDQEIKYVHRDANDTDIFQDNKENVREIYGTDVWHDGVGNQKVDESFAASTKKRHN